jgi:soluble lytic murein transglycosylase
VRFALTIITCLVLVTGCGGVQDRPGEVVRFAIATAEVIALQRQMDELEAILAERLRYQQQLQAELESIAPLVPPEYRMMVIYSARSTGLDPQDIAAVGWVESRWQADAVGSVGEVGPMQIIPSTGEWIAQQIGLDTPYDLSDPATNIAFGAAYLRMLLNQEGSMDRALASYNGGPNAWDHKPISTRGYVERVRAAQQMK